MAIKLTADVAGMEDVPALVKLDETCFVTDRLSAKKYRHFVTSQTSEVVIIREDKKLIAGAVILFRKNSTLARIYSIAVAPEFRKLGVAQMLYDQIESLCFSRKISEIRLEVRKDNEPAIKFYLKNKYLTFGEYKKFYQDGQDAFRMRKIFDRV